MVVATAGQQILRPLAVAAISIFVAIFSASDGQVDIHGGSSDYQNYSASSPDASAGWSHSGDTSENSTSSGTTDYTSGKKINNNN